MPSPLLSSIIFCVSICFQQLANMFENLSSSEWLLYISEWQHQNQSISNIRVTTKVAVHSLLSTSEDLQIRGAALIHNLACKEVKTVVCILPVLNINILTHLSPRSRFHLFGNYSHLTRIEGLFYPGFFSSTISYSIIY